MASSFDELIELARRLGVEVRHARLGGSGGGLVMVKGKRVLFIDVEADPHDQLDRTVEGVARVPGVEEVYVRGDVREMIERKREDMGRET